ncbi:uncharacterized protein At4g02000-like [Rosa rugosa]|uniref:uncharacterized protein At4g02000-like n=1 Tax=Rosa rugosa TaxID=74645 RepID=UPI002B404EED|nr:uncharacterized protein At4g02000-like [Rosa rugosa]
MNLWRFAKGLAVKSLDDNLFLFRFHFLEDLNSVLQKEPWSYAGNLLLMERVVSSTSISNVKLSHVSLWVHVHKLPWLKMTDPMAKLIGDTLGVFLDVDRDRDFGCIGGTMKIRVRWDVSRPLCRKTVIELDDTGDTELEFSYERVPGFCAFCGLLTHWTANCPWRRYHPPNKEDFLFQEVLKANHRQTVSRRFPRSIPASDSVNQLPSPSKSDVGDTHLRETAPAKVTAVATETIAAAHAFV